MPDEIGLYARQIYDAAENVDKGFTEYLETQFPEDTALHLQTYIKKKLCDITEACMSEYFTSYMI